MTDYFLKFPDLATALTVLAAFTYTDEDGITHLSQGSHQYALDEVGEIPGYDGWHINLRVIDPELEVSELEPYRVFPETPSRVWA